MSAIHAERIAQGRAFVRRTAIVEGKKSVAWELHGDVIVARFITIRMSEEAQVRDAFAHLGDLAKDSLRVGGKLLLDLSSLQFMSSSGLAHLVGFRKKVVALGVKFRICSLSPLLTAVLASTGLSGMFDIHPTAQDALAAFKAN